MNQFFKSLAIFAAIVCIVLVALGKTTTYVDSVTWGIFGYFVLLTAGFHYGLLTSSKGKPQQFVRYYMGATSFKLLIHIVVMIVYCIFNRQDAVRFILSFAVFYLAFTVFEFMAVKRSFRK